MTFLAIKLAVGSVLAFVIKHWRSFVIVATVIALFVGVSILKGCWVDHKQGQVSTGLNADNKQINQTNNNSGLIEGERDSRKQEVKDAEKLSKRAVQSVNDDRVRDSNIQPVDTGAARERFCKTYPGDSKCVKR